MRLAWRKLLPTTKIFHQDPYQAQAMAIIMDMEGADIVLDQTVFYAESGGQVPDKGTINGYDVVNVQKYGGSPAKFFDPNRDDFMYINSGTFIIHTLSEKPNLNIGDAVELNLDWQYRYNIMKNHTAAHFLYAGIQKFLPDGKNISLLGCSINDQKFRFDIAHKVTSDDLTIIEEYANTLILQHNDIIMNPLEDHDDVFFWNYSNIVIPCGGTHVKNTKEIFPIKTSRKSKGKNNTRVEGELII